MTSQHGGCRQPMSGEASKAWRRLVSLRVQLGCIAGTLAHIHIFALLRIFVINHEVI